MRVLTAIILACALGSPFLTLPVQAAPFRASLILEHGQPSAWNELLRQGLNRAAQDFNIETEVIIAPRESDQTAIFRETAANSDLVLVAGANLHEILRDNASNFRRTKFGSIDAGIRASNIMSVSFADQEAAFLAGAAAAMLTTATNLPQINPGKTVGWLAGEDTPSMRTLIHGFEEGAKLANPEIRLATAVSGSFTDPIQAAQKAAWLADKGCDIVVLASGAGNPSAAAELARKGVLWIDLDKTDKGIMTIRKAADKAVYEIVESAAKGNFRAKEIVIYDLANGGVDLAGLDEFLARARPANRSDVSRRVRELKHELINGSIKIKSFRLRTLCDCL